MAGELRTRGFRRVLRSSSVLRIAAALLAILVAGGLYCGYAYVPAAIGIATGEPATEQQPAGDDLPAAFEDEDIPIDWPTSTPTPRPAPPASPPRSALLPPLPGERVNILLLGLDQRDDERAAGIPARSDTMVLVTLDPATRSGGLLSLPRDLWVAIPGGYRNNKINVAHFLGELDKQPGGGPGLAKRTVAQNFGLPVHYYIRANFRGFESVIDTLGGIDVDVPKHIIDRSYPTENYGYMTIEFQPGLQHMDGVQALQYARTRHQDNDFQRNQRQQQVLLAARDKLLRLDLLPRLPWLLGTVKDAVDTDIPMTAMPGLLRLVSEITSQNVVSVAVEPSMVYDRYIGSTDLVPKRGEIPKLVARLTADPKIVQEKAKIVVENGAKESGLVSKVRDYLEKHGYAVSRVDRAERYEYAETVILDHTGTKEATLSGLAALLEVPAQDIRSEPAADDTDITVIVGADAAGL